MPVIKANGLDYFYLEQGKGTPLLFLHGFMGSSQTWREQQLFFAEQYRTVAIDLPGHGLTEIATENNRYSIQATAKDILAILDGLDFSQTNLLGYSMGGRLALFFALTYPKRVNRLVLESASPGLETTAERTARANRDGALACEIENLGIAAHVKKWEELPIFASQKALPESRLLIQRGQRLANSTSGLSSSLRGMGTGRQPPLWDMLASLRLPTFVLSGQLDCKYVAIGQKMVKAMPNGKQTIVDGAGHNIHLEKPAAFSTLVDNFLRDER